MKFETYLAMNPWFSMAFIVFCIWFLLGQIGAIVDIIVNPNPKPEHFMDNVTKADWERFKRTIKPVDETKVKPND